MRNIKFKIFNNSDGNTHLRCKIRYDKGGQNVWDSRTTKRGYYISINPIKIERGFESYVAYSGYSMLVKEVKRASKKAEAEADRYFDENVKRLCREWFPKYECE